MTDKRKLTATILEHDQAIMQILEDARYPVPIARLVAKLAGPSAVDAALERLQSAGLIEMFDEASFRRAVALRPAAR